MEFFGKNPTILSCGHLCQPMAAFRWTTEDGIKQSLRWCEKCREWETWVKAPDLDIDEIDSSKDFQNW